VTPCVLAAMARAGSWAAMLALLAADGALLAAMELPSQMLKHRQHPSNPLATPVMPAPVLRPWLRLRHEPNASRVDQPWCTIHSCDRASSEGIHEVVHVMTTGTTARAPHQRYL